MRSSPVVLVAAAALICAGLLAGPAAASPADGGPAEFHGGRLPLARRHNQPLCTLATRTVVRTILRPRITLTRTKFRTRTETRKATATVCPARQYSPPAPTNPAGLPSPQVVSVSILRPPSDVLVITSTSRLTATVTVGPACCEPAGNLERRKLADPGSSQPPFPP
ncbi:hypothetical protein DFJ74DRAFT_641130 [Hyaloraphidium curvatum]|nr:hypothetical protein DFJ74DRAFT_641130 [Hyaloraphidium curvatum]